MKGIFWKGLLAVGLIVGSLFITPKLTLASVFTDVGENHPYLPAIRYLKQNGVIIGYSDGSFKPDQEVNRAEALKIITLGKKILGEKAASQDAEMLFEKEAGLSIEQTEGVESDFDLTDVPPESWYHKYVFQAFKNNIIRGYDDRTFRPSNTVNLAEAVKILLETNAVELPATEDITKNPFRDASMDEWYAPYLQYAKEMYILIADMNLNIHPDGNITRQDLANLIYRFYTLEEGRTYGRASYYADYFEGRGTASGEKFAQELYTAAQLTLPFGSLVKVVNLENDKSVVVRINDRGPYDERFVLDLSRQAFETISPISRGVIQIYYQIIHTP